MFELKKVKENDKEVLRNLLEYYLYDFNYYYEDDLNENGRFEFIGVEPYINNNFYKAFFILVDNHYAGFVLTYTGKEKSVVEEFWIMPKYRKGMFAFEVLTKVLSKMNDKIEFVILNKNERWLKVVDYWIRKNYQVLSMENIKKWETEDFTKYTILNM